MERWSNNFLLNSAMGIANDICFLNPVLAH